MKFLPAIPPDVSVRVARLADHLKGFYDLKSHTIWLDDRLSAASFRCTLHHELIHAREGHRDPGETVARARQEWEVHSEVARRLIRCDRLIEQWRKQADVHQLSASLFVDEATLRARIQGLSPAAVDHLAGIGLQTEDLLKQGCKSTWEPWYPTGAYMPARCGDCTCRDSLPAVAV